jgi:membrane-bound inhibitor of C-type lysozyme
MKNTPLLAVGIIVILLIVAGAVYFVATPHATAPTSPTATSTAASTTGSTPQNQNTALYTCDAGKTITANFLNSTLPASSVMLVLSDGRSFSLPQVMSGSGIRYEEGAGTSKDIQFSSEGDNAFLSENGTITYNNCVAGTTTTSGTAKSFTDQGKTFTFTYPSAFAISGGGVGYSTDWMVNATTSGLLLVKATLPSSFEPKTNFADATFTVGTSPDPTAVAECLTVAESGGSAPQKSTVTINGVPYAKFITNDAGAGNLYETTSYRTVRNNQCYAIEYTIHSSQLANYPPSAGISAFDQARVVSALESIVQSFKFL